MLDDRPERAPVELHGGRNVVDPELWLQLTP